MRSSGVKTFETVSFQELIRSQYLAAGHSKEWWLAKLMIDTGISRHSLRAAYAGTRINPKTALALTVWAAQTHHVDLDQMALIFAPDRAPRAKRRTPAAEREC